MAKKVKAAKNVAEVKARSGKKNLKVPLAPGKVFELPPLNAPRDTYKVDDNYFDAEMKRLKEIERANTEGIRSGSSVDKHVPTAPWFSTIKIGILKEENKQLKNQLDRANKIIDRLIQ